jgi:hypothetical protein
MRVSLIAFAGSLLLFFGAVVAQDADAPAEPDPAATESPETEEAADDVADEAIDEQGLDVQGFEPEDDDDFVPTEDIPADQSIPFPTDI